MSKQRLLRGAFYAFGLAGFLSVGSGAWAQWSTDPSVNTRVCTATLAQDSLVACSDGAGGAIAVWRDRRDSAIDMIYAQRITATGQASWFDNGNAVATTLNSKSVFTIASDRAGGVLVAWRENRTGTTQIYAQRLDSQGNWVWGQTGVQVTNIASWSTMNGPVIDSDGQGGAIVVWSDNRVASNDGNVYAQRIGASGNLMWTANGVTVCNANGTQTMCNVLGLGSGNSIVAWGDPRVSGIVAIYAQRLDSLGASQWTANGVQLCGASGFRFYPHMVSDDAGGAILAWEDLRGQNPGQSDIYARRIDASGVPQWANDGVPVCTAPEGQIFATSRARPMIPDGAGGAVLTWNDYRTSETTSYETYAQRLSSSGTPVWAANGIPVITTAGLPETNPAVASDGAGNFVFTWIDVRLGLALGTEDIFAQGLTAAGAQIGGSAGTPVSNAAQAQNSGVLVSGAPGSVISIWQDSRNGNTDIYANRFVTPVTSARSEWYLYE